MTSTCSSPYRSSAEHSEDDMAYLCSKNLLSFLLKYNTKFLEKYKRCLIFGSGHIYKDWAHFSGLDMLNFRFLEKMIFLGEHEDIVDIFGVSFQNLTILGVFSMYFRVF